MQEIWKDIKGYEELYQVSNFGKIKSLKRYVLTDKNHKLLVKERMLKQNTNNNYKRVQLWKNGKGTFYLVHRVVASAFLEDYNEELQVNHKNGIKNDNKIENLEMVTAKQNQWHSYHVLKTVPSMQGHFGSNHVRSIKVNQFDKSKKFIKSWNSVIEASCELNIPACCISNTCAKRRKTAGGYIWEYANK